MLLDWLSSILEERLGHRFLLGRDSTQLYMRLEGFDAQIVFDSICPNFFEAKSSFPCSSWHPEKEGWESILQQPIPAPGQAELVFPLIEKTPSGFSIHYDILGLTYWMLSRQEEVGRTDLDDHQRFPATSSHAFKHGYLERPLVDEWLQILGQVVKRNWPTLELRTHVFGVSLSHDVDEPSRYAFCSPLRFVKAMAGDALRYRNFNSALKAPWARLRSKNKLHHADPANTFEWIMDVSEQYGLKSAFYFICGRTDRSKDASYEPEHLAIRGLMKRIHARGHEIGLHPSYGTFKHSSSLIKEAERLRKICAEEGIAQLNWGGRMHYLRWETPTTLQGWEEAGFTYETTLGYADLPGFRCGTCFEYPAFDPVAGRPLRLRIRPLIAMESTVIAKRYLGLGTGEGAFRKFSNLIEACRAVGGNFTLLWHNSQFEVKSKRELYEKILKAAFKTVPATINQQ